MTKHLVFFVCFKSHVDSIMFKLRFISEMHAWWKVYCELQLCFLINDMQQQKIFILLGTN